MIRRSCSIAAGLALAALLAMPAFVTAGSDGPQAAAKPGDVQCSCRSCEQEVCCQTPTGFAAMDDKCKPLCGTKRWVVPNNGSCGTQPGCCATK